jgi:hypothetical protein
LFHIEAKQQNSEAKQMQNEAKQAKEMKKCEAKLCVKTYLEAIQKCDAKLSDFFIKSDKSDFFHFGERTT